MKRSIKVSEYFPKHLFWDVDLDKLQLELDKDLIIPRALFATTENTFDTDIKKLEKLYSHSEILNELKNTRESISNQVCELVALRYHVPQFHRFKLWNQSLTHY